MQRVAQFGSKTPTKVCSISLSETDAATSNERLGALQYMCTAATQFHAHWFCSLHQCQISVEAVTATMADGPRRLMSGLYSLALLLKNSALFLRMKLNLGRIVAAGFHVMSDPAPPAAMEYSREVCQYALRYYRQFTQRQAARQHHWLGNIDSDSDDDIDIDKNPS